MSKPHPTVALRCPGKTIKAIDHSITDSQRPSQPGPAVKSRNHGQLSNVGNPSNVCCIQMDKCCENLKYLGQTDATIRLNEWTGHPDITLKQGSTPGIVLNTSRPPEPQDYWNSNNNKSGNVLFISGAITAKKVRDCDISE